MEGRSLAPTPMPEAVYQGSAWQVQMSQSGKICKSITWRKAVYCMSLTFKNCPSFLTGCLCQKNPRDRQTALHFTASQQKQEQVFFFFCFSNYSTIHPSLLCETLNICGDQPKLGTASCSFLQWERREVKSLLRTATQSYVQCRPWPCRLKRLLWQGRMPVTLGEPETARWSCESSSWPKLQGAAALVGSGPHTGGERDRKSC